MLSDQFISCSCPSSYDKDELDCVHRDAVTNDVLSDLYRGSSPRQYLEGSNIHHLNLCLRLEGLDLFVKISAIELA